MKIVVINARGLHLGYVGGYGNEWVETPALDRLAAEGVVFDGHFADRPDGAGAVRGWLSGRYHFPGPDGDAPPADPANDLLRMLRQHGVAASLVADGSRPAPAEFAAGWDNARVTEPAGDATALEAALEGWQGALDGLAAGPWLLWLDLATLLPPWDVPAGFLERYLAEGGGDEDEEEAEGEPEALEPLTDPAAGPLDPGDDRTFLRLQRTYAAAVSYLDAGLDLLLKELEERRLLDDVLLVVTSDHGLPLGEHGAVGLCRPWLHEELIHLPLLLRLPGGAEAGRRVAALTQPVDLAPTLLDAFGLPPPPPAHGHSLLPLARGAVPQVRAYACAGLRVGDGLEWALRTPEWAFLLPLRPAAGEAPRPPQLYVKPDDRWEVNNVVQHHLELAEHLEQTLRGFVEATRRPGRLEPPQLRAVEAVAEATPDE
jgi:arylsulfatase A-like enzyme